MNPYLAHISLVENIRQEQTVAEHLRNTAEYAGEKLEPVQLFHTGRLAGILHDMGKYTKKYLNYLEKAVQGEDVVKGSVNHTFAGVIYLFEQYYPETYQDFRELTCEIVSFAIGSHHGEFDCVDVNGRSGFDHRIEKDKDEIFYEEAVQNFLQDCMKKSELDELFEASQKEITDLFLKIHQDTGKSAVKKKFLIGLAARFILSALIDADRRDTAEFMSRKSFPERKMTKELWREQLTYFEEKIKGFSSDTPINRARSYISKTCAQSAHRGCGIYKLTVPTGAGKTLATLRYALTHAQIHGKSRIIFIIPLLSVIEQNSKVIRDYIKDKEMISENHSNVVKSFDSPEALDQYELLSSNWSSPIILSTLVQFLELLFSDKTTAIRRMSALANSVIVIDEVQSLPGNMLNLFNMALNFLSKYCNATIVLSSATQPCFDQTDYRMELADNPDLVPVDEKLFSVFKRTNIVDKTTPSGMSIDELAEFSIKQMSKISSLLVVGNTKSSIRKLYERLKQLKDEGIRLFHLSASMCMQHRIDTLEQINACLKSGEKIICTATQLVEAGVDFSFESVIRVEAGMDNIAQAAGRCNRNGEFNFPCNVYIVNLKDENLSMLKDIRRTQQCTEEFLYRFTADMEPYDSDLLSEKSVTGYYKLLFAKEKQENLSSYPVKLKNGSTDNLFNLLSMNRAYTERPEYQKNYFLTQAFKTANGFFQVFDNQTIDVIVPYNKEADKIIADLCSQKAQFDVAYLREKMEKAKRYTIQLYEYQMQALADAGMLFGDKKDSSKDHFTALNALSYSIETGLKNPDTIF